eukprot:15443835-Alexandrium_andersonii.AAC.1
MSASLVGSEMCIRDRYPAAPRQLIFHSSSPAYRKRPSDITPEDPLVEPSRSELAGQQSGPGLARRHRGIPPQALRAKPSRPRPGRQANNQSDRR